MRWSPGPISPNIEDRRFQWENDPEGKLVALQNAVVRGEFADPNAGFDPTDLPPWMWPQAPTQEALVDRAAGQQALLGLTPVEPTGYDYDSAVAAGLSPHPIPGDTKPHWGSRSPAFVSPAGIPEGLMLKGEEHPTERLGLEGERAYGNQIVQRDGRQVSVPPQDIQPTDNLLDLARMLMGGGR